MEANELMIGDWVYNNPAYFNDDYNGVTEFPDELQSYKIERGEDLEETGCYSPIPLTAEILEKNGFECEQMEFSRAIWNTYKIADNLYFAICGEMKACGYYVGQLNDSDYIQNVLKIDYVHELQHALRLCGIEKNIEL